MFGKKGILLFIFFTFIIFLSAITSLEIYAPKNSKIYINNELATAENFEGKLLKTGLPARKNIEVLLLLKGYEPYSESFKFKNSFDKKTIKVSLDMLVSKSENINSSGSIQVLSIPSNVNFNLDKISYKTDKIFDSLSLEKHNIEFFYNGERLVTEFTPTSKGEYVIQANFDNKNISIAKKISVKANQNWEKLYIGDNLVSENDFIYEDYFDITKIFPVKAVLKNQSIKNSINYSTKQIDIAFTNMVFVKGGTFMMGSNSSAEEDEKPAHKVTLNDFEISRFEVTQKEYRALMGDNPSFEQGDELPVDKVSWMDAVRFCNIKSESEGLEPCYVINGFNVTWNKKANGYRLPTEAEWEYAARGGNKSKNYKYAGGNDANKIGWYVTNSNGKVKPIGTKAPNELDIYDMSGNVTEMCWDAYGYSYYTESPAKNPTGPTKSLNNRVVRGGNARDIAGKLSLTKRIPVRKTQKRAYIGFRIARNK